MGILKKAALQLQDRDLALLCGLFECRVMTIGHVATLYFEGKLHYAYKRVQQLKSAGYAGERKRNANEPSVLFLTRKGFLLLGSRGCLWEFPSLGTNAFEGRANVSSRTLNHELEVMDVKTAFHGAAKTHSKLSIHNFRTWPRLYEFKVSRNGFGSEVLVKPDGFINIHEKEGNGDLYRHDFYLEVDRSSEQPDTLVEKASCYLDFYKSGGFAVRSGGLATEFERFPFRVLMVFKSIERRNNVAERLLQNSPPILTHSWLTTKAEVKNNPFGTIWVQPKDYRQVISGTPFEANKPNRDIAYRRQYERDQFVERYVKKVSLFEI